LNVKLLAEPKTTAKKSGGPRGERRERGRQLCIAGGKPSNLEKVKEEKGKGGVMRIQNEPANLSTNEDIGKTWG